MRDFTYDFTSNLLSDAVWVLYDTAKAFASALSDNLNIHFFKDWLEAHVGAIASAVEVVEALFALFSHFAK
jgi:hypothetical protein